jgi:hypothetical protein
MGVRFGPSKHELPGDCEVEIRNVLDTVTILSSVQSDENFGIANAISTDTATNYEGLCTSGAPVVVAKNLTGPPRLGVPV